MSFLQLLLLNNRHKPVTIMNNTPKQSYGSFSPFVYEECIKKERKEDKKVKKDKKCSFCRQTGHCIRNCPQINDEFNKITEYFSNYENKVNVVKAKEYLLEFDPIIISRYIIKNRIELKLEYDCFIYYNNIKYSNEYTSSRDRNIELLIAYLVVLPLHPEMKIRRPNSQPNKKNTCSNKKNTSFIPNLNLFNWSRIKI
jgi:hypothetical protein